LLEKAEELRSRGGIHSDLIQLQGSRRGGACLLRAVLIFILAAVGCRKKDGELAKAEKSSGVKSAVWFEDVTQRSGLQFKHEAGEKGKFFMPETVGSGGALFDYDNDGRLDIYLIQNAGPRSKAPNQRPANTNRRVRLA